MQAADTHMLLLQAKIRHRLTSTPVHPSQEEAPTPAPWHSSSAAGALLHLCTVSKAVQLRETS